MVETAVAVETDVTERVKMERAVEVKVDGGTKNVVVVIEGTETMAVKIEGTETVFVVIEGI